MSRNNNNSFILEVTKVYFKISIFNFRIYLLLSFYSNYFIFTDEFQNNKEYILSFYDEYVKICKVHTVHI